MELFQTTRRAARQIARAVQQSGQNQPGMALENIRFPIPPIDVEMVKKRPGWMDGLNKEQLENIGEQPDDDTTDRIYVKKDKTGKIDQARIEKAMNEFVTGVLGFVHFDLKTQEFAGLGQDPSSPKHSFLLFDRLRPAHYSAEEVGKTLDKLEKLVFRDWHPTRPNSKILEKHFASENDSLRARFMLQRMARALGESDTELKAAFPETGDKCVVRVKKDFMDEIVQAERTFEADYMQPPQRENRGGRWV